MGLSEKQLAHLKKLNANQKGSNNRNWRGDKVKYAGLHLYIRKHLPKPNLCQMCLKLPSREVANLDGQYTRDLNTWKWACRSCNLVYDNVANKAWQTKRNKQKSAIEREG